MRLISLILILIAASLSFGCAQRESLSPQYGKSYQQIFYLQGTAPPVQLAPTTAEDAKRITESRNRRSNGSKSSNSKSSAFSGGGTTSNFGLQ